MLCMYEEDFFSWIYSKGCLAKLNNLQILEMFPIFSINKSRINLQMFSMADTKYNPQIFVHIRAQFEIFTIFVTTANEYIVCITE